MGGLTLTVLEGAWRAHVQAAVATWPDLIPVVKGNGYGFGRTALGRVAAELYAGSLRPGPLGPAVAVGTVYEMDDIPSACRVVVLTPVADEIPHSLRSDAVLTVGAPAHVAAAAAALGRGGWNGDVVVKLRSAMHRYGCTGDEHDDLLASVRRAGLHPVGYSLHLPLSGAPHTGLDEVEAWLAVVDPDLPLTVSHLDPVAYAELRERHGGRRFAYRAGTALWHGDKSMLALTAPVIDVHPVRAGEPVGYRRSPSQESGRLVMVGAGTAHGVHPLADGRSPFHFAKHRLALVEPPHMHTSMVAVPDGLPCPAPGDRVDVARPLTQTLVDTVDWQP